MSQHPTLAYLAPEIPSLSATFVYDELLALEARGFRVYPFSVRRPVVPAADQVKLSERTVYLYESGYLANIVNGLLLLASFGSGSLRVIGWLWADMLACGFFRVAAWKLVYQCLVAAKLARLLKQLNCAHMHVHFAHVPAQIAMYASAMSNVPFTVMAHANDIFERGLLLKQKAARSKKFLTSSEFNRSYLLNIGLPSERLAVMRCGVSFALLARPNWNMEKSSFRIGTLGRLVEKKGIDILLGAIDQLRDKSYSVQLSIVGDGPLRFELEKLVRALDLTDRVTFEGSLSHSKVADWMQGLDVFALACKTDANGDMDGIPVVLMEAMSQGVPVISTRLSGIPELVIDQQTGLLADPNDAASMAKQIDKLLSDSGLCSVLKKNAQKLVLDEFSQSVNLDRLISAFGHSRGS